MKNPAIYKINDKALNNGMPTIYSESTTIFNDKLMEVPLPIIIDNMELANGCKVYLQTDNNLPDRSNPPEDTIRIIGNDVFVETKNSNFHLNPKLYYSAISDTRQIANIEKGFVDAVHVTSCETVTKGQWTVIYSKPNVDTALITLSTVTQQISKGLINGEDVLYFNIDGPRPRYIENLKILKRFNVTVLDGGAVSIINNLINNRQAKNKIIIIDALLPAYDPMSYQKLRHISELFRSFCELGGTVISLANAKKYVDDNGAPVLEGEDLLWNDAHCVYYLTAFDDIIKMINTKKKSNVKAEVTFQIGIGLPYPDLFNSVRTLTDKQAVELSKEIKQDQLATDHEFLIMEIVQTILNGINKRTALTKAVHVSTKNPKSTIYNVLDKLEGKLWKVARGPRNTQVDFVI